MFLGHLPIGVACWPRGLLSSKAGLPAELSSRAVSPLQKQLSKAGRSVLRVGLPDEEFARLGHLKGGIRGARDVPRGEGFGDSSNPWRALEAAGQQTLPRGGHALGLIRSRSRSRGVVTRAKTRASLDDPCFLLDWLIETPVGAWYSNQGHTHEPNPVVSCRVSVTWRRRDLRKMGTHWLSSVYTVLNLSRVPWFFPSEAVVSLRRRV